MVHQLTTALSHDLWAQADPVAFLPYITRDPLRGSFPKPVLHAVGWLDQKSPNLFSDVAARDLGLASAEGSFRTGLVGIPDATGPLESAHVMYATAIDVDDPAHAPFVPPLTNQTQPAGIKKE